MPPLPTHSRNRSSGRNRRTARQNRIHTILGICVAILLIVGFFAYRQINRPLPFRPSFLIVSDPSYIVSFTPQLTHATVLDVPSDVVIRSVYGYGDYSVGSLVSLDDIDKKGGKLIAESVADAYGIPIRWSVRPARTQPGVSDARKMLKQVFSWGSIAGKFSGERKTDIPTGMWVALVLAVQSLPSDRYTLLSGTSSVIPSPSPDGSSTKLLDESKLDYNIGQEFADSTLRNEGVSVALYNATDIPSAASRLSRSISRLGIQLVFVGNAEAKRKDCRMSGSDTMVRTKTAEFFRLYYGCDQSESNATETRETGADLIIEIGEDIAGKYR